jgi:hypothetical protein
VREHFVVPSIGSRDVACAEWPNIRRFEHFLQLLNLVNDSFNVHASQSSKKRRGAVNRFSCFDHPKVPPIRSESAAPSTSARHGIAEIKDARSNCLEVNVAICTRLRFHEIWIKNGEPGMFILA